MSAGARFDAFGVGVTAMMMMVAGRIAAATTWTEKFIPYNGGDDSSFGDFGPYGLTDPLRQHLHFLQTPSSEDQPSPVFFWSHQNGGDAIDVDSSSLEIIANSSYSVISWESVSLVKSPEDMEVCWSDFDLVWEWFHANAAQLNLDPTSVVIGGRSRGSACSWPMAHSQKPEIKGIYMYNALPNGVWGEDSPWVEEVTAGSPPAHLVYGPECEKPIRPDCVPSPDRDDGHNPRHGQKIVDRYTALGRTSTIRLTDGLKNYGIGIFDRFPAFAASLDNDDHLVYVPLPSSTTPGGHCMDGSMAGYYIRKGSDPNLFVIYLQGGGSCADPIECERRVNTDLGSSINYPLTRKGGDFLNPACNENPLFCKASAVYIPYCSSDGHSGTAAKSEVPWGYYFEGRLNFKAFTERLASENGLHDTNEDMMVLVTGKSAGGGGALRNVDWLQERLPLATVKTAPDAGGGEPSALADDLPSLYPPSNYANFVAGTHGNNLYDLIQEVGEVVDVHQFQRGGALAAECLEQYVNDTHNLWWACLSNEQAYQYIQAPIFKIHTLYDRNHIYAKAEVPKDIVDPTMARKYIDMYGTAFLLSLEKLLNNEHDAVKAHPDGVFAASCLTHGTANDVTIAPGITKIDIVGDWFFQRGELTEYHRQIEQCPDTEDGLQLPCNPGTNCQFQFPSPLVEACTQAITDAGCLNFPNEQKCNKCLKRNKEAIVEGGCTAKNKNNVERVAMEICELQYAAPTTVAPTTSAPTTATPTTSPDMSPSLTDLPSSVPSLQDPCVGLRKGQCNKNEECVYGKKKVKKCLAKENWEHACEKYTKKAPCEEIDVCKFKNRKCSHRCAGLKKLKCQQEMFCMHRKVPNPCFGCQLVTTCGTRR